MSKRIMNQFALLIMLLFSVFIVAKGVSASSSGSNEQYCYMSPNFEYYFTSNQRLNTKNYVEYPGSCSNLNMIREGCCIYKSGSISLSSFTTLGHCQYIIGSDSSFNGVVFVPGVSQRECSPSILSSFDCTKLSADLFDENNCLKGSIYRCNQSSGKFVADCSKCDDTCGGVNGLTCDKDSGYCLSNIENQNNNEVLNSLITFNGLVKNKNGNPISDALIIFFADDGSSSFISKSNSSGGFSFNLPSGKYSFLVAHEGYSPYKGFIKISQNKHTRTFVLTKGISRCDISSVTFKASNVQGKPWIKLYWYVPYTCEGQVDSISLFKGRQFIGDMSSKSSYTDDFTEWNKTYNYSLTVKLSNGTEKNLTVLKYSGDKICAGQIPGHQFCYNKGLNSVNPPGAVLRGACDTNNKLEPIEGGRGNPSNCSLLGDFICAPTKNYLTECVPKVDCTSLGGTLGLSYSKDSCLADNHYCYYDFSNTILDICYNCAHKTCSDFKSEEACDDNNCGLDCYWEPTNKEFNKGLCLPAHEKPNNKCSECNSLFMNCSAEDCSYLGSCFMNGTSCVSCDENSACSDYKTKDTCEGIIPTRHNCAGDNVVVDSGTKCCPGLTFLPLYDSSSGSCLLENKGVCSNHCGDGLCEKQYHENSCNCPQDCSNEEDDSIINFVEFSCSESPRIISTDACNIGLCKWEDNKCVKDADDNHIADCSSLAGSDKINCLSDRSRPTLSLASSSLRLSNDHPYLSFNVNSNYPIRQVFYSVFKQEACPERAEKDQGWSIEGNTLRVYLPDSVKSSSFGGKYHMVIYVKDKYGVPSLPKVVDFYYVKSGLYFNDFEVNKAINKSSDKFNVQITVGVSKEAVCSYNLTDSGKEVNGHVLFNDLNNPKELRKTLILSNLLGNYNIIINCSDEGSSISYSTILNLIYNPLINITVNKAKMDKDHYGNYPILFADTNYNVTLSFNKTVSMKNVSVIVLNTTGKYGNYHVVGRYYLKYVSSELVGNKNVSTYLLNIPLSLNDFVNNKKFIMIGYFDTDSELNGGKVDSSEIEGGYFKVVPAQVTPIIHFGAKSS